TSPRTKSTVARTWRVTPSQQPLRARAEIIMKTKNARGIGDSSCLRRLAKREIDLRTARSLVAFFRAVERNRNIAVLNVGVVCTRRQAKNYFWNAAAFVA